MFVELGASMLLIAAALYIIAQIPLEDILKAGITLTVMIVIIGLLAMLVGKSDSAGKGIAVIAIGLLAIENLLCVLRVLKRYIKNMT